MIIDVKKNKNIIKLWLGNFLSNIGDTIYLVIIPWMILDITGSKGLTALITVASYLPALIFGLFAGSIIDHYERKKIMFFSNMCKSFLTACLWLSFGSYYFTLTLLGVITFVLAIFSTFYQPARDSLVPELAEKRNLSKINSAMSISMQISQLVGPLFAGFVVYYFSLEYLFIFVSFCFFFSSMVINFIFQSGSNKLKVANFGIHINELRKGVEFVFKRKRILYLLGITFINNIFIMGPAIIGIVVYVKDVLSSDFIVLAQLETAMATGMIMGAFLFYFINKNFKLLNILLIGMFIDGITFSALFFTHSILVATMIIFLHGLAIPMITVARTTLLQELIPEVFLGRVFAMTYMSVIGATAISIGLTGLVLDYISAHELFLIIGIFASACAILGKLSAKLYNINIKSKCI